MSRVLDIWFDTKRENIKAGSETQNDLAIFVIILSFLCMMGDFAHLAKHHWPCSSASHTPKPFLHFALFNYGQCETSPNLLKANKAKLSNLL